MTCVESVISLAPNPSRPTKQWGRPTHLGSGGPGLFAMSYYLRLPLDLGIMKICMDFGPYDTFLSSDVLKMVDQQNSWNSLVIGTYLLYLAWNIGMLVVNICIL
jgi:hypothetical protein